MATALHWRRLLPIRPIAPAEPPLAQPHLLLLMTGVIMAAAPHLPRLPVWVGALTAVLFVWRAWAGWREDPLPRRWLLAPLTLLIVFGVYLSHHTLLGRDAGVTLLVVLLALKLLEMRSRRDVMVTTALAYFLALASFFYTQRPLTALIVLSTVVLLTTSLSAISAPQRTLGQHFRTAGMLLVQSVPLMVILFFLFPRVQAPLWGLPADAFSARTGLSDSMSPGTISALSQSDEIAFRVKFEGEAPTREQLYWRGPVFWDYDGRTWRAGEQSAADDYRFQPRGEPVRYTVTLEPHDRNWLFGLEMPAVLPPEAKATADYQLLASGPVRNRMRYTLESFPQYRADAAASDEALAAALALPPGFNPRTLALAASWRASTPEDDHAVLRRALTHFSAGGYRYTLFPPLAGTHAVDEFLFDSRAGFCEHYAGAFVVLMRAAGVPARVVTGYQGGEMNPVDGYMSVRQSDAHAWAEVFLPDAGWVRIDPTAAAVPLRTSGGLAAAVPGAEVRGGLLRLDVPWLRTLRFNMEALSNAWNQWVLGYDPQRQRELLIRLGMPAPEWQHIVLTLFWTLGFAVLLLSLWLLRRAASADPAQRAWLRFCAKMRRAGLPRRASEGPISYATRAALARPAQAQHILDIARLYAELRYGPHPDRGRLARLARMVQSFRA